MSDKAALFEEILKYPIWRHRIPLNAEGFTTMGYLSLPNEWSFNYLPEDLKGKSFLDVGSNDGYFCFDAERRGAVRSTGVDLYHDGGNSNREGWSRKGVDLLKSYFGSNTEFLPTSIYDLESLGVQYDVVLCSNVISWLDNINEALRQLSRACKGTLYLKDGFLTRFDPEAVMQYERHKNLVNFRVNLTYAREALLAAGFKTVEVKPIYHFEYFDWQSTAFAGVTTSAEVDVLSSPNDATVIARKKVQGAWVLSEFAECYFLRGHGWVKKGSVQIAPRFQPSWKNKLIRSVLSKEQYGDFVRKRGTEPYVKQYMVIAKK